MSPTFSPFEPRMGGTGFPLVSENHFFGSDAIRDAYFAVHPDQLNEGMYCVSGGQLQRYVNNQWVVHAAVIQGKQGKSAYDLAVQQGFTGNLDQWLSSLNGGIRSVTVPVGEQFINVDNSSPANPVIFTTEAFHTAIQLERSYTHIQQTLSDEWVIDHCLDQLVVSIYAVNQTNEVMYVNPDYVSPNRLILKFAMPTVGQALIQGA